MKYVIRKTGEIVDVIKFSESQSQVGKALCEYFDSKGKYQCDNFGKGDMYEVEELPISLKAQIAMKVIEGTDLRKNGAAIDVVNMVNTIWKGIKYD